MTKTTNYQLNQWDAADQVKRVDFNADNAKIDAALAGLNGKAATAPDVLLRYSLSPANHTAAMNFTQAKTYDALRLLFWGKASGSSAACLMQMNGVTESGRYFYAHGCNGSSYSTTHILAGYMGSTADGGGRLDLWLYPAGSHTLVQGNSMTVAYNALSTTQVFGAALNTSFSSLKQISMALGPGEQQFAWGTSAILLGYKF